MGVKFSPIGNGTNWIPGSGLIANGYKLFFYAAGTTTKQNTYTTHTGGTANDNPIILNSYGRSANEIWLTEGLSYKVVIASGSDTDPPASGITLGDYITGINDSGDIGLDQWIVYGSAPTYISATSFSVTGDQAATFHVGRRIKTTNTGGTIYSTITATAYASVTTITVVNDSGTLDPGLSAVSYSILTSTNPSIPKIVLPNGSTATTQVQSDVSTLIATNAYAALMKVHSTQDFRLTLTTAVPVTTADVSGATTVYMTPYIGNKIGLYNGTTWDLISSAEISLALGTLTSDLPYDVFCYNNSGTATLEFTAWTNTSTRATALVMQDGVLCKTGALTRRYLGTFLTTSTTQTEDSDTKRYLFNYYHRKPKNMQVYGSGTWSYGTATWRQANADTSYQLNFLVGVVEQQVSASLIAYASNTGNGVFMSVCIGLNTTSSIAGSVAGTSESNASKTDNIPANICITPALGKNYLSWMEYSSAANTTWNDGGTQAASVLIGTHFC